MLRGKVRTFFKRKQKTGIFDDPAAIQAREGLVGLCTINRLKAIKGYKVIYV